MSLLCLDVKTSTGLMLYNVLGERRKWLWNSLSPSIELSLALSSFIELAVEEGFIMSVGDPPSVPQPGDDMGVAS